MAIFSIRRAPKKELLYSLQEVTPASASPAAGSIRRRAAAALSLYLFSSFIPYISLSLFDTMSAAALRLIKPIPRSYS